MKRMALVSRVNSPRVSFGVSVGVSFVNSLAYALALLSSVSAFAGEVPLVFNAAVNSPLPVGYFPTMFKASDLDGDGFADLVVPARDLDHRLVTLKGNGTGGFAVMQTLISESAIDWVDLVDIDNDGQKDILAAWRGSLPRVVIYRGIAGGLFDEAVVLADIEAGVGRDPQGITTGDFDGDGDLDCAVASYVGQSVEIYSNITAKGGALAFERTGRVRCSQYFGGYGYPRVINSADLDADGDLDLILNELGGSRVCVLRNEAGRFARSVEYRAPQIGKERPGIAGLSLADVDADGDIDAYCPALLLAGEQKIVLFKNDGTARFTQTVVGSGSPSGYAFSCALKDLDTDGDLDAICGAAIPGTITLKRCTSALDFTFEEDVFISFGSLVRHVDAVDYDGDCDLDLIAIDGPSNVVYTRRNVTPQVGCGGGVASSNNAKASKVAVPQNELTRPPSVDRNSDGVIDALDLAIGLDQISQTRPSAAKLETVRLGTNSSPTTPSRESRPGAVR